MIGQIRYSLFDESGKTFETFDNFGASLAVKRLVLEQDFKQRSERLIDIKSRVALPALQNVELPSNARNRGADQSQIHLT